MDRLIKESVKKLKPYIVKDKEIDIKLDANENPYNIINELKEDIFKGLNSLDFNRYPDNDAKNLKGALAQYCGVNTYNIICGNGSDEIISSIINAFVDKNETVLTHSPTFGMYKITTEIAGGKIIEIDSEEDFKIDVDPIIDSANKNNAKIIFLCNPNNPTGAIIAREDIIKVLENTDSIVVVDEAYYEFYGESVINLIDEYEKLIVLRTLSKAYGLAGLRIGYGVSNKKMIDILNTVKSPYNLNSISQIMGVKLLENKEIISNIIDKIIENREELIKELKKFSSLTVYPTYSNFILVKAENYDEIIKVLEKNKISVRNYGVEGNLGKCIRISVGTKEENKRLLNILKEVEGL